MRVQALFTDIGGVLLTNGWDRDARKRMAETVGLDFDEMDERHHLTFDAYELGKLSLDDYLNRVVFHRERPFTREKLKTFMLAQSQRYPQMIDLVRDLKGRYGLKVVAVSNEGRELTIHRVRTFDLGLFVDFFVSSCFVHCRKPDPDIFRIALDIAQVPPEQVVYIDDRDMFVDVAQGLGIRAIHHTSYESTRAGLDALDLAADRPAHRDGRS